MGIFKVHRKICITSNVEGKNLKKKNNMKLSSLTQNKENNLSMFVNSRNIPKESLNERLLSFEKRALILKKEHPHFHEEIGIKRIMSKITVW